MKTLILFLLNFGFGLSNQAQNLMEINIQVWGAKGDGTTNNTEIFRVISDFVSIRKENVKIFIPKGIYIVGAQVPSDGYILDGRNILELKGVRNVVIEGEGPMESMIKYKDSLWYGSFDPKTMRAVHTRSHYFNKDSSARIGNMIYVENSSSVSIRNLDLNGNNLQLRKGGDYDNIGIQLSGSGILVLNSTAITVKNVFSHHFPLDGIMIGNVPRSDSLKDEIDLSNSRFSFNGRQGFSWIGGNGLTVRNCMFDNTGMGGISSLPGAGVDIEGELGPNRYGFFTDCTFENNKNVEIVSATGENSDCNFSNCTFWGSAGYATWITKPNFVFTNCRFYGIVQHGFSAKNGRGATKYIDCIFSDLKYNGLATFGGFLLDANSANGMNFENCKFKVVEKKIMNITGKDNWQLQDYYSFRNCTFKVDASYPVGAEIFIAEQAKFQDCILEVNDFYFKNKYYIKTDRSNKVGLPVGINIRK